MHACYVCACVHTQTCTDIAMAESQNRLILFLTLLSPCPKKLPWRQMTRKMTLLSWKDLSKSFRIAFRYGSGISLLDRWHLTPFLLRSGNGELTFFLSLTSWVEMKSLTARK